MPNRDRQAFVNYLTGTFTDTSEEWFLSADQWSQTYWQFRDGKLYFVENDNKEQTYNEREEDIDAFLRRHAQTSEAPYPEIVAFIKRVTGR